MEAPKQQKRRIPLKTQNETSDEKEVSTSPLYIPLPPLPQEKKEKEKKEPQQCPICFEEIDETKPNFVRLNCNHTFCFDCINTSLKSNNTCPCCRDEIEPTKRKNPKALTIEDGIEIVKDVMDEFNWSLHLDTFLHFQEPDLSQSEMKMELLRFMKQTMRLQSMHVVQSIIEEQNDELGEYFGSDIESDSESDDSESEIEEE